jgi:hydroxymethylglutaryl-CoA reductase
VCLATGQDWRAVESAAHVHASISGKYQPLTRYEVIEKKGVQYFKGILELPIAVGTVGGALEKNPIYKVAMQILGNPDSKDFS